MLMDLHQGRRYDNLYNSIQTDDGTSNLYLQYNSTGAVYLGYGGGTVYAGSNSGTVWHAGNDGSGSGLDAIILMITGTIIKLDSLHGVRTYISYFPAALHQDLGQLNYYWKW